MTQSIEYIVKVNASQAQKQIDDLEKKFGGVNSVVVQVDKNLIQIERDIKDLNAAIAAGGPNVEHYKRQLAALQGPMANVGRGALEASRAIEDLQYGFGGIVNNIPSLVMALGGGAGLTAAFSLAAVGMNQVIKHSGEIIDEFGRAERESKALNHSVDVLSATLSAGLSSSLTKTRGLVEDMRRELRLFGLEAGDIAVAEAEFEHQRTLMRMENNKLLANDRKDRIAGLEAEVKAMETHAASRVRGRDKDGKAIGVFQQERYNDLFETLKLERSLLKMNESRVQQAEAAAETQKQELITLGEMNAELKVRLEFKEREDKLNKAAVKDTEALARLRYDMFIAEMDAEDEALKAVNKARARDAKKHRDEMERDMLRAQKDAKREEAKAERDAEREAQRARRAAERERVREHKRALAEIARAEKELADYQIGLVSATTGQMMGAVTDYLMAKIEGEEYAEQKAIASFLSATGQQLVASGVRGVFEGAIMSANPLTPGIGAGMIATGGAAIVAGLAMAGGGAAVSSSIPTATSGSGASSGTRDPGASPRGSSLSSGGGGPMIINVSYGAGGPLPEDIAREIGRVVNSGNRRRGAA